MKFVQLRTIEMSIGTKATGLKIQKVLEQTIREKFCENEKIII